MTHATVPTLPSAPTRILIAPDKFKGSLEAGEVAAHVAAGLRRLVAAGAVDALEIDELPVADGGEGTVAAAVAAGFGPVEVEVTGPLGGPVRATYAARDGVAVIEMAAASGLAFTAADDDAARGSGTYGTGELVSHALDHGARRIVLGVGGSASTDGGAGLAQALGLRLTGPDGELGPGGDALRRLVAVDASGLDRRLAGTEVVLASDVDNPLLGPDGAAAVYGGQKGADAAAIIDLDAGLARWVEALTEAGFDDAAEIAASPGAGAAGGLGFAALALLGASRRPGVEVVLDLIGFDARVAGADLVITGEGSLDEQSMFGKTPVGVAAAASASGVPTVAVAGRTTLTNERLRENGILAVYPLTSIEPDVATCLARAGALLEDVSEILGRNHLSGGQAR
jgi:glycerate kinase